MGFLHGKRSATVTTNDGWCVKDGLCFVFLVQLVFPTILGGNNCQIHFIDEETEVKEDQDSCLRLLSSVRKGSPGIQWEEGEEFEQ
jgi:hypothetical protein